MDNMIDHYQAVLRDLETRRSRCKQELDELDSTISGIKKLLSNQASLFVGSPVQATERQHVTAVSVQPHPNRGRGRFAGMSVRWAVLNFLSENQDNHGAHPSTAEIAQALRDGGVASKAADFTSNVSAVLSVMASKRGEVIAVGGAWVLTENGRAAWKAVQSTPQYQSRLASAQTTLQ